MFSSILSFHGLPIASAGLSWKSYVTLVLIVFCDSTAWSACGPKISLLSKINVSWTEWSWIWSLRGRGERISEMKPRGSDVLSRRCPKMIGTRSCAIRRRTSKDGAIARKVDANRKDRSAESARLLWQDYLRWGSPEIGAAELFRFPAAARIAKFHGLQELRKHNGWTPQ
jgi:hypothetical protein